MDEQLQQRIELNPDVMVGKPVIRGTRIPVELVIRLLAQGISEAEVLQQYPRLQPEDIRAALMYAARVLAHENVFPPIAHLYSPRRADPNQETEFQMEIINESSGGVQPQPSRIAGLHTGAIQLSHDFDEPLTEEFEGE